MNKFKKIFSVAILLILCSSAFMLTGCQTSTGTLTVTSPTSSFQYQDSYKSDFTAYLEARNEWVNGISFTITINNETETLTYGVARENGATISVNLLVKGENKIGSITYKGITGKFTYTVV